MPLRRPPEPSSALRGRVEGIADCIDEACPKHRECRRWQPEPRLFHGRYAESPRKGDECEEYWPKTKEKMI
jgi:hypothetical protein